MSIAFKCPECGKQFQVDDNLAGRLARCKRCGWKLRIPKGEPEVPVAVLDEDVAPLQPALHPRARDQPSKTKVVRRSPKRAFRPTREDVAKGVAWVVIGIGLVIVVDLCVKRFSAKSEKPVEGPVAEWPKRAPYELSTFKGRLTATETLKGPIEVPPLPSLGKWDQIEPGILIQQVGLPGGTQPGFSGKFWVYVPAGEWQARSLPCVMITCAGNAVLTGRRLAASDLPEHLPYVRAGFAVLAYEMDGKLRDWLDPDPQPADYSQAVRQFAAARAGLINAHIALEFLLARMPQVDPDRIYTAGLGSAGSIAMLFAETDRRIKGCVAYSPVIEYEQQLQPRMKAWFTSTKNLDFLAFCSPRTYESKLNCPIMLFHAGNDLIVPVRTTSECAKRLIALGKSVTLKIGGMENHYVGMTNEGIPAAIEWLKSLAAAGGEKARVDLALHAA